MPGKHILALEFSNFSGEGRVCPFSEVPEILDPPPEYANYHSFINNLCILLFAGIQSITKKSTRKFVLFIYLFNNVLFIQTLTG
jgi:hypothetical protein